MCEGMCVTILFPYSFTGQNWISTLVYGADSSWEVRVKGNLTQRADTGKINTSPISAMPPIVHLQHGCNYTIEVPGKSTVKQR